VTIAQKHWTNKNTNGALDYITLKKYSCYWEQTDMDPGSTFTCLHRYEQKYLLDRSQYDTISRMIPEFAGEDEFGQATIYSIYYDTDDYILTKKLFNRSSYKEKLRLRSYGIPRRGDTVYLELKKKLKGISYKQRLPMRFSGIKSFFDLDLSAYDNYVSSETNWFLQHYKPLPKFMLWYDRLAFWGIKHKDFRITFDTNIRWHSDIDYTQEGRGYPLLDKNTWLMELKVERSIPLFLVRQLTRLKIFPVSFSKHKIAYENLITKRRIHV
jgi:SPX domain protein involved in polyphosphate accumulation